LSFFAIPTAVASFDCVTLPPLPGLRTRIDQTQPGGTGSDYTQIAGQKAKNEQKADADATAVQIRPENTAGSIRVLSPGDDGDVDQSNSTTAIAAGLNDNETKQSIDQTQGSASKEKAPEAKERVVVDGHMDKGGSYTQIAGQEADNEQKADADATAVQWKPSNTAGSIRVLSPGDGGDVRQSNDATAVGIAKNDNETKQSIDQVQGGGQRPEGGCGCVRAPGRAVQRERPRPRPLEGRRR